MNAKRKKGTYKPYTLFNQLIANQDTNDTTVMPEILCLTTFRQGNVVLLLILGFNKSIK